MSDDCPICKTGTLKSAGVGPVGWLFACDQCEHLVELDVDYVVVP